jgi:hypothetical protein
MTTDRDDQKAGAPEPGASCKQKLSDKGVHVGPSNSRAAPTDFSGFVLSLAEAAMIEMGLEPVPEGSPVMKNLKLAQQTIDILHMLKEKTAGNLTSDEDKLLSGILYQLHLCFVEAKAKG